MVTAARMEGVVEPGKNQSYQVNVATKIVSSGELKNNAEVKYYGLNGRGPDTLNTQVTGLELVFGKNERSGSGPDRYLEPINRGTNGDGV